MYLHLGQNTVITTDKIIGIFDIDTTTISAKSRYYLSKAEKEGRVINVSTELPKSFVVTEDGTVYISQLSVSTLENRI